MAVVAIAFGLDTGFLDQPLGWKQTALEQRLFDKLHPRGNSAAMTGGGENDASPISGQLPRSTVQPNGSIRSH